MDTFRLATISLILAVMGLASGCVVTHDRGYNEGYQEGYYDRDHHRWWHENAWQKCVDNDEHCH